MVAGDLPHAIAHSQDGLATLPAAAFRGRQRADLLICLANAAGLAGNEERAVACHRELAALIRGASQYIRPRIRRVLAVGAGSRGLAPG